MEVSDFLQEWVAKGEARGIAKGREEGRAEARVETLRMTLTRILQARFGPIPAELIDRIAAEATPATLEQWLDQAVTAASLDDLRAAWNPPG